MNKPVDLPLAALRRRGLQHLGQSELRHHPERAPEPPRPAARQRGHGRHGPVRQLGAGRLRRRRRRSGTRLRPPRRCSASVPWARACSTAWSCRPATPPPRSTRSATRWPPAWPTTRTTAPTTNFENRAGDHHDGMEWFGLSAAGAPSTSAADRGLLAVNHEATTDENALFVLPARRRRHDHAAAPGRRGRQGTRDPRRLRRRGAQDRHGLGQREGLGLQPPPDHADRHRDRRPGARQRAAGDEVLDHRHADARHAEQLRHRQDALGQLRHRRGELGRLLHPPGRRQRRTRQRQERHRAEPLRPRRRRRLAPRLGKRRCGRQVRALDQRQDRRLDRRQRRLPQRDERHGLHRRARRRTTRPRRRRSAARWAASRTRAPPSARRWPASRGRVPGRRRAQRVHLQVRLHGQLGRCRRRTRPTAWPPATSTSTAASCTRRSSTPTARGEWLELSITTPAIAGYATYAVRRPGRRLRELAPRRRRRRRHEDGPARSGAA